MQQLLMHYGLYKKFVSLLSGRIPITLILLTVGPVTFSGCARLPPGHTGRSEIESVEIAQSSVKAQYKIGFCWAYATIGLIESNYKISHGKELNLSEEALGYARMKEEMLQLGAAVRSGRTAMQEALNATQGSGLEGWYVRTGDGDRRRDAMELIDDYGLVPEDSWNVKFESAAEVASLKNALLQPFYRLLSSTEEISPQAIDKVLTSPGAFPSSPPKSIVFNNVSLSPVTFASQTLQFHSGDYVSLQSSRAADMPRLMDAMKRMMAAGYSVPLSFAVSFDNLDQGFFRAANYELAELDGDQLLASSLLHVVGGHAVLATDFVNRGGQEGALAPAALQVELLKDPEEIEYVKFKNSWGTLASTNERGVTVASGSDGYYRMDAGYIKANAAIGRLGVVVLRQFAQ